MRRFLSFIWAYKVWWIPSLALFCALILLLLWLGQTASIPAVYSVH